MPQETWLDAPWIETEEDYSIEETSIDLEKIAWFDVRIDLGETDIEKKEHIEAMKEQVKLGILQPNGLPTGMHVPQATINAFNAQRKLTPLFKIPNGYGQPNRTLPIKNDIFTKANQKMSMMDELTRDRRRK